MVGVFYNNHSYNMLMKNKFRYLACFLVFLSTIPVSASLQDDIGEYENKLATAEEALFAIELELDELYEKRSGYDGVDCWFDRQKSTRELDSQIAKQELEANKLAGEVKKLSNKIQSVVYEIAKDYESDENYEKAVEYYLKNTVYTDKIKERIAFCYKQQKDYSKAIRWLLELPETDLNLLEVVEYYFESGLNKEAYYWIFKILEPFSNNASELEAFKLAEEHEYQNLLRDYPDYYRRLSEAYIQKAYLNNAKSHDKAVIDYQKATELRAKGLNKPKADVKSLIKAELEQKHLIAEEIYKIQKIAVKDNMEDRQRSAEAKVEEAENNLKVAQEEASKYYDDKLTKLKSDIISAEANMKEVYANKASTLREKDLARREVDNLVRHLERITTSKNLILRDYVSLEEVRLREARNLLKRLNSNRGTSIEKYLTPYKALSNKIVFPIE